MRRYIFNALVMTHFVFDRILSKLFGIRFRQQYIRLSYRIKIYFFPEYGNYIPRVEEIGSAPESKIWFPPAIPEWVISEMKELGREIDPAIYPTDHFIAKCQYYSFPVIPKPGVIYGELIGKCTSEHYTHCFAIPWIKRGGADLVSLAHIECIAKQANYSVLVMLTEPGDSPWLDRLPKNVDVLKINKYIADVSHDEILLIIVRLIIQLDIDVLHIINSRHAWEVVSKYGRAITQRTKIYASIYCDDYDKYGCPVGFARQYLHDCYPYLSAVFSDNATFPALLNKTYGFPQEIFHVIKSPFINISKKNAAHCLSQPRVLWAGRLDRQKRPDLLLAIARKMPDVEFHVFGDMVIDGDISLFENLKKTSNICLNGTFDGAESLPFEDFQVFLYTSQWDGIPTIILSAALAGIPIVASAVGGVNEVITKETGFPIFNIEDICSYVNALKYVFENQSDSMLRAVKAQTYVKTQHSPDLFEESLKIVDGYLSDCLNFPSDKYHGSSSDFSVGQ